MKKNVWCALVLAAASILTMVVPVNAAQSSEIFVDPLSDGGDGSFSKPYKTLEEARDAVRKRDKSKKMTVYLRGGNYNLNDIFKLSQEDSGEAGAPVVWEAYNNETVNITGGARLKMSDFQVAKNSAIDKSVDGKVMVCNLKQKGIDGYDMLHITGHAQHYLLEFGLITDGDTVDFGTANPEIIFDGTTVGRLAQYPNDGYMTIDKVLYEGDRPARWGETEDSYMYVPPEERHNPPHPPVFTTTDERISHWTNAKDAWVKGYWYYDWSDQSMRVDKVDPEKGSITPKDPSGYSAKAGQRFFIFNLLEELDVPGEWYYDKSTGDLYVYPTNADPESELLLSFSSNNIIEIDGAEYITLKNLNIAGTRNSGIVCTNCKNVDILYCEISNISGDSGIKYTGAKDCRIIGCHVYNVGAKCIDLQGGKTVTLEPGNNLIENCWLHNFGRLLKTYAGGIKMTGVANTARNNLIYDGDHLAINLGGNDHIVENNDIHSVLKEAADMGAIYMGRKMAARGTVIRNNAIHDLVSDSNAEGQYAVYLDDQQCGYTVCNNIIFNTGEGVFINGGRDNTVRNNIFASIKNESVIISDQGRAFYTNNGIFDEDYLGITGIPIESELYSKYPHMNNLRSDEPLTPKYNIMENNLNYNVLSELRISLHPTAYSTMTTAEMKEKNTLTPGFTTSQNPGFMSAENGNFTLKEDSKVFEVLKDFENISMDKIGLITSRLKEALSDGAVVFSEGNNKTYKNWKKDLISEDRNTLLPFSENGTFYVPLRYAMTALDAEASYGDGKIICAVNGSEYIFSGKSRIFYIDGAESELSAEIIVKGDRAYIGIEDLAEIFSKKALVKGKIAIIADNVEKIDDEMLKDLEERM